MKKFYNEPSMTVETFDMENVVTASENGVKYTGDIDSIGNTYSVKTIDVSETIDFTF